MSEKRLIELETRLMYQEQTIQELNDALASQQQQLDRLEATCRKLIESVRAAVRSQGDLPHEKPPHY